MENTDDLSMRLAEPGDLCVIRNPDADVPWWLSPGSFTERGTPIGGHPLDTVGTLPVCAGDVVLVTDRRTTRLCKVRVALIAPGVRDGSCWTVIERAYLEVLETDPAPDPPEPWMP